MLSPSSITIDSQLFMYSACISFCSSGIQRYIGHFEWHQYPSHRNAVTFGAVQPCKSTKEWMCKQL
jgi:hypothetical protein